jgi:hypothetical protein
VQSKGHYCYFFCLGQKNDPDGTGPEPYVPADRLDTEIEAVYQRIQLAPAWLDQLREDIDAEVTERQHRDAGQREFLTRQLARAETQRRKLLDAYYTEAIDVRTLKTEQDRIGADITAAKDKLADLDATTASGNRSSTSPSNSPPAAPTPTARPPTARGGCSTRPCSSASRSETGTSPPRCTANP